jgi:hypothetical protein
MGLWMNFELMIENKGVVRMPSVLDGMTLTTERKGIPGKLTFTVLKDNAANFTEGNLVHLTVDGKKMFYGFVFSKRRDREQKITVTAYDQLRYLQNKDICRYTNKTASDVVTMIAEDFDLQTGEIEKTGFVIPFREKDNVTLLDIINDALYLELSNKKQMFVLYDDFGKLTLKSLDSMRVNLWIDEETGENFEYTSSIDDQTYNKVKLSFDNEKTGKRDIYVVQDGNNINNWGILQYFDTLKEGENGEAKAAALLDLYNAKTRKLKITKAFGDTRVRAGCLIPVQLHLGDVNMQNFMLVEKCVHTFGESDHRMDLILRGGEFVG